MSYTKVINPRFPHTCVIRRGEYDQLEDVEEQNSVIVYEGECRNFQQEYVKTTGEVMQSIRCTAIPLTNRDWTEETLPRENDWITAVYSDHTEEGMVIDKQTTNLGTDIYWTYERN